MEYILFVLRILGLFISILYLKSEIFVNKMSEIDTTLDYKFGAQTLFALRHTGEICGSNGLPLTPKSIGILGKSQILKTFKHASLATYLDFIRGKHGTK